VERVSSSAAAAAVNSACPTIAGLNTTLSSRGSRRSKSKRASCNRATISAAGASATTSAPATSSLSASAVPGGRDPSRRARRRRRRDARRRHPGVGGRVRRLGAFCHTGTTNPMSATGDDIRGWKRPRLAGYVCPADRSLKRRRPTTRGVVALWVRTASRKRAAARMRSLTRRQYGSRRLSRRVAGGTNRSPRLIRRGTTPSVARSSGGTSCHTRGPRTFIDPGSS
jgi:hypothetical protein